MENHLDTHVHPPIFIKRNININTYITVNFNYIKQYKSYYLSLILFRGFLIWFHSCKFELNTNKHPSFQHAFISKSISMAVSLSILIIWFHTYQYHFLHQYPSSSTWVHSTSRGPHLYPFTSPLHDLMLGSMPMCICYRMFWIFNINMIITISLNNVTQNIWTSIATPRPSSSAWLYITKGCPYVYPFQSPLHVPMRGSMPKCILHLMSWNFVVNMVNNIHSDNNFHMYDSIRGTSRSNIHIHINTPIQNIIPCEYQCSYPYQCPSTCIHIWNATSISLSISSLFITCHTCHALYQHPGLWYDSIWKYQYPFEYHTIHIHSDLALRML